MGIQGRRAGKEDTGKGFASQKMLSQELLGCIPFNPTDTEHCLLHHFIGVKKKHHGTQEFFSVFLGSRVTVARAHTTNQSCKLHTSLSNADILSCFQENSLGQSIVV